MWKKMKKIFTILSVAAALVFSAGCNKFGDMNTSQTSLTIEQLPPANMFARMVYKGIYADYQRNFNLYDDMYAHYFADNTTWWSGANYAYNDGWAGCLWWEFYDQSLQYWSIIEDICEENGSSYDAVAAVTDVFSVYQWSRLTDRWGDIPYTGAGEGEAVDYTDQKTIYLDLLDRLDADGQVLSSLASSQYDLSSYDLIYGGDYTKWKKFCYSLMLRLATRISRVDPTDAATYAQKAISGGVFTSYSDVAVVPYDASVWSDYYDRLSYDWGQTATEEHFISVLNGTNPGYTTGVQDPRLPIFFKPVQGDYSNAGEYVGFPNGDATSAEFSAWTRTLGADGTYTDNSYSVINEDDPDGYFYFGFHDLNESNLGYPVMTYSEVLFCRAELALRGILSGDAESLWKSGIEASIYEAADHTSTCGQGTALVSSSDITTYINALPDFGSSNEDKLRSIIIQKWIALYPNSVEGWNEIRRTGYPDIYSGVVNYPGTSSSALVQSGNVIQRLSYPDNAYDYDEEHIPSEYQSGGSKYSYREQYGVWWSLAGDGGTFAYGTKPNNF